MELVRPGSLTILESSCQRRIKTFVPADLELMNSGNGDVLCALIQSGNGRFSTSVQKVLSNELPESQMLQTAELYTALIGAKATFIGAKGSIFIHW